MQAGPKMLNITLLLKLCLASGSAAWCAKLPARLFCIPMLEPVGEQGRRALRTGPPGAQGWQLADHGRQHGEQRQTL